MAANLRSSIAVVVLALSGLSASAASASTPLWQVLTDYEGLQEFVSSIRQSTVKEREPGRALVEQYGVGRAWMVSLPLHVILEIHEHPRSVLTFRDVCGESFTSYEGKWELTPIAGGTRVTYQLKADLSGRHPALLVRSALHGSVKKLLVEVRSEMETRGH